MEADTRPSAPRRYAVFLSYRHADNKQAGRQWATWLHQTLEGYEIPPDLVGARNGKGDPIPASLYPVFRDEEELPADADLTRNIRLALENSALLVVICSPRAVESSFVADEIRYFKELGKSDRILAVMIDGEPNASIDPGKARAGIPPEAECLPEPLRYGVARDDGTIDWTRRTEPIAADLRPDGQVEQGWTTGAAYREALRAPGTLPDRRIAEKVREYEQRLELAKLKIVAGAIGVPLGVLTQRDQAMQLRKARQHARVLAAWLAGVGVLGLLALAGGTGAVIQRQEAIRQRHQVELALSQSDYAAGVARVAAHHEPDAVAYLARALRTDAGNRDAASLLFSVLTTRDWVLPRVTFQQRGETIVAVGANGHRALTLSEKALHVWDIDAPRALREIDRPDGFWTASFTPDGRRIVVLTLSGSETVDVDTGAVSPTGKSDSTGVDFSPDGQSMALIAGVDAREWGLKENRFTGGPIPHTADGRPLAETTDGRRVLLPSHGGEVLLWGPDGHLAARRFDTHQPAAAPADNTISGPRPDPLYVWGVEKGEPVSGPLPYRGGEVKEAAFSPDGLRIAVAGPDGTVRVWDAASGQALTDPLPQSGGISALSWSSDGRMLLAASDQTLTLWDTALGKQLATPLYAPDEVLDAWFAPDGKRIVAAVLRKSGVTLDPEAGLHDYQINPNGRTKPSFYGVGSLVAWDAPPVVPGYAMLHTPTWAIDAEFSPDGRHVATLSGNAAQNMDVSTGTVTATLPMDDVPVTMEFSPDGQRLLLVDNSRTARVWDVATGHAMTPPIRDQAELDYAQNNPTESIGSITFDTPKHPQRRPYGAFAPDGKSVAIASGFSVRLWDAATGKPVTQPMRGTDYVRSVAFSADGRRLVVSSRDVYARVWEVATQKLAGDPIHADGRLEMAAISPDGKFVATASDGHSAQVWNTETGQAVTPPMLHAANVTSVAFSPDGKRLLTVSGDTARVWDAMNGTAISAPMVSGGALSSARFSPDGRFVAIASADGQARVWDAETGSPASIPLLHTDAVDTAAFSADGRYLATAGEDGAVRLWPFYAGSPPAWTLDFAEALAGRRLDGNGNPTNTPVESLDGLRQQANDAGTRDALAAWAGRTLRR